MKRKYKWIVLATVAAATMAALVFVNLQNSRQTGPRRPASAIAVEKTHPAQRMDGLGWISQGVLSGGA